MLNYVLNALLNIWLITRAYPQDIFCSKNENPWKDAMTYCLVSKGQPMSFHGITNLSIENINLRPDVTVWTSDYFYLGKPDGFPCLCSFHYLTQESFYKESEELFSYCDDFKYFFCRNKTSGVIEVLNNTWNFAEGCGLFPHNNELKSVLKPGYYWKSKTNKCGFDGIATWLSRPDWNTHDILCGAYSKEAGRHFRPCDTSHNHTHVCVSSETSLRLDLYNDSCFIETDSVANVSHTQSSDMSSTIRNARGPANENAEEDTEADAGLISGIVVGVCLASIVVVVLLIFILRRYRCLFDKNTTSNSITTTIKGTKNQPNKTKARTVFNNIGYDTCDDNQKQNNTIQSKRNNTEMSSNAMPSINQLCTAEDEKQYYNQTNSTPADITDQQTNEASSYSFAVETESNVGENEMSLDEYDSTISTRKEVYKTENVYNKLEPVNESRSDVYDSTLRQMQPSETGDVYNKLSCNYKYGKFGTTLSDNEDYDSVSNTLKSHNTQLCTDNVYN